MVTEEQLKKARDYNYLKSKYPKDYTPVKGYDFSKSFDFKELLNSYKTTGFQATHLGIAIDLIKKMREENVTILLSYTSNVVTSGLRDVIAHLVRKKLVHVLCTSAGGVEEDIMKCHKPFILGDFKADTKELYVRGMNRTGNIYTPDEWYVEFEKFLLPILEEFYQRQKKEGKIVSTPELIKEFGEKVNDEGSIVYWAAKNNIPIFCPGIVDGAIGDVIWFFKHKHPDFKIDVSDDIYNLSNLSIEAEETGAICLGSGLPRHYLLNSNIFKGGVKYAVYITTAGEGDGSTSGSKPSEAYTWGKIELFKPYEKNSVLVEGDATIIFPLIVAGAFII